MRKPGWFTPQIPGLFCKRADGDWDYFPFGRFGRGYRVRAFDKDDLCDALFRFQFALVVILGLVFVAKEIAIAYIGGSAGDGAAGNTARTALSLVAFVGVAVLGILLLRWYVRGVVKVLPLAETRLTRAEAYLLWAARFPKLLILLCAVVCPVGFVGILIGIWHVMRAGDWRDVPGLLFIAAVWGFGSWYYVQTWRHRPK